ncbi:Golgi-associated RAB2 interactor protein 4 [Talpa occidentalis]|uniref:Golgi-associated RAB2 interactor protein 4 n=1 Tax=Talpa occidentalis TaxID=50954 RepID=UPI00188E5559|nr:Golgi-associated RAB2 interactor protein 4 [Talpa occidentalis]
MATTCALPYHTAKSGSGTGMFNTAMGKLQRQLHKGEYDIFRHAPIFESDFIQITKRGEVIDVHNRVRMVTVAVASTSPMLPMPDVMLLARPATGLEDHAGRAQARGKGRKGAKALELTRLLPLKFVRLSIHDREKQQLRLKFATGRSCYLQLCPALDTRDNLFAYWEKLTYLLRPPMDSHSSTYALPAGDMVCMPVFEEEELRVGEADCPGRGDQDQVSIRSLHGVPEVAGATSAAFSGGEGIPQDTPKPIHVHYVSTSNTNLTELPQDSAAGAMTEAVAAGVVLDQLSPASAGAAQGRGGSRSNTAPAGAAPACLKRLKAALAGATSQSTEAIVEVVTVEAEPTSQAVSEPASSPGHPGEDRDCSALAQEEQGCEGEGRQRGSQGTGSRQGRRERRERREKERTLRSRHRRATESHHKAGGDKMPRKLPSGRPLPNRRASRDDKEKGRGGSRRGAAHKGLSHVSVTKESRSSHKSARSLSTLSSSSAANRLSRVGSFLRSVKANLTTKALVSPWERDQDLLPQPAGEALVQPAESCQGPQATGSVPPEDMDTVTIEVHS